MPRLIILIAIILLIAGLLFYCYEYRPTVFKTSCHEEAIDEAKSIYKERAKKYPSRYKDADEGWYLKRDYDSGYKECLRAKGLNR